MLLLHYDKLMPVSPKRRGSDGSHENCGKFWCVAAVDGQFPWSALADQKHLAERIRVGVAAITESNRQADERFVRNLISSRSHAPNNFPVVVDTFHGYKIGLMKKILLLIACSAATPCFADDGIPLRPMPPFHRSEKTCLSVYDNGAEAYWFNSCEYSVAVRWDDDAKCQHWSCLDEVPANARLTATISRHVRWCECPGTLSTCHIPTTGC